MGTATQSAARQPRPFKLFVDSANEDEPRSRRFTSLEAALTALEEPMYDGFRHFAWIIELSVGSRGFNVIHVRDGEKTPDDDWMKTR